MSGSSVENQATEAMPPTLKKQKNSAFASIVKFTRIVLRKPGLLRVYFRSNKKEKYSLRDVKSTGILFLHIPKCAGVSVNNTLYGSLGAGHKPLDKVFVGLGPIEFRNVFKFTIVRNPWDRLVSAYFFLRNGGFGDRDRQFYQENLAEFENFEDFVLNWLTPENIRLWNHFRLQADFLSISNTEVDIDYLCFLESIDKDFQAIYDAKHWTRFKELKRDNRSKHDDYRSYYTEKTKKVVEQVYQKDIELFGYDFSGKNLHSQRNWRDQEFPLTQS